MDKSARDRDRLTEDLQSAEVGIAEKRLRLKDLERERAWSGKRLAELDAAKDPSITVCAPSEFGFIDDDVCRGCAGYAECAARRIRMAAGTSTDSPPSEA